MRPQNWNLVRFAVQNDAQVVASLESSLVFTLRLGGASGNTYDNGTGNFLEADCVQAKQRPTNASAKEA